MVVKGQCETEQNNITTCYLPADQAQACNTCLDNNPFSTTATSCQEVESSICSIIIGCETSCGACVDELNSFADCVSSVGGCGGVDCSGGSSRTGTVLGSFLTVSLVVSSLLLV
jgi:hypothetical protein